jgi:hypothetical protein
LPTLPPTPVTAGAIERSGDRDYLAFAAAAGTLSITVALVPLDLVTYGPSWPYTRADVDLRLQVFSNASLGTPLATFDPQDGLLTGTFTVPLPAEGMYFVSFTGVGEGADASAGYSNYGSLGEYSVALDFPTAATAAVVLPPPSDDPPEPPPDGGTPPPPPTPDDGGTSPPPDPSPPPPWPWPWPSPSPSPSPPPDASSLVLKVSSAGAVKLGPRWRAVVVFAASVGGAPASGRSLVLSVSWTVTPDDASFPTLTRTARVPVKTRATGAFTVRSPAALGRAPAATAELTVITVSARAEKYNSDASDATAVVSWP